MIFAAINWLAISINLLLVVFVIVCLLMALLILMQRPKQEGLGAAFGGGVTDQVFGARTTNVLQKGTVYLGSLFFILSLTLAILIGKQSQQKSLLEPEKPATETSENATVEEGIPEDVPTEPESLAGELPTEAVPAPPASIPAEDAAEAAVDAVEEITEEAASGEAPTDDVPAEAPAEGDAAPVDPNEADKSE